MRCKTCCGCEHGRLRGQCRECGGSSSFSAITGGSATAATARSVAAAASASTGGSAASARSVAAAASASTGARASTANVECGGSSICEQGRLCTTCMKECDGSAIHKHRRQHGLYEHKLLLRRQRSWCRIVAAAASFPWRKSSTGTRGAGQDTLESQGVYYKDGTPSTTGVQSTSSKRRDMEAKASKHASKREHACARVRVW